MWVSVKSRLEVQQINHNFHLLDIAEQPLATEEDLQKSAAPSVRHHAHKTRGIHLFHDGNSKTPMDPVMLRSNFETPSSHLRKVIEICAVNRTFLGLFWLSRVVALSHASTRTPTEGNELIADFTDSLITNDCTGLLVLIDGMDQTT